MAVEIEVDGLNGVRTVSRIILGFLLYSEIGNYGEGPGLGQNIANLL